jgi:hypothetical protein
METKLDVTVAPALLYKEKNLSYLNNVKGAMSRDFMLQVFFMNHLPPDP